MMIIPVADGFWNIRGVHRIGGLLDVGTQASLVRRASGAFLLLDSYTLPDAARREVDALTGGGEAIEAILNLHPFHTVHVAAMHRLYPRARLYGTARHRARLPELPWERERTDEPALHARFADDLDFSVPRGVELVPADERVHFSSVIARHRASRTMHVDDTLTCLRPPAPLRRLGLGDLVRFHPTLARALERRSGAARDFRAWAEELGERFGDTENLCAAHTAPLLGRDNGGAPIRERVRVALRKVEGTLRAHERAHG